MMKNKKIAIALACVAFAVSSPSLFAQTFKAGEMLYTQTDLHQYKKQISAANFLVGDLIPAGSAVKVVELSTGMISFEVINTHKTFYYSSHKQAGEPFKDHLKKVFGVSWDPATVTSLSEIDQKGIAEGTAFVGMSRKGVIIALGYPPHVQNPSLTAAEWTYWNTRYNRIKILFDEKDIVTEIAN